MRILYLIVIAACLFFIFLMLLKMFREKAIYDKMNGLSVINTNVVILILVFGFLDGRPEMYIDIAIAYGILGFVGNIVVARYVQKYHQKESLSKEGSSKPESRKGGTDHAAHS